MKRAIVVVGAVAGFALASGGAVSSAHAADGKAIYQKLCSSCHGASGHGDGVVAASLNPKPSNLVEIMSAKGGDYVKKVATKGGAAVGKSAMMPAVASALSPEELDAMIAYIKSLK